MRFVYGALMLLGVGVFCRYLYVSSGSTPDVTSHDVSTRAPVASTSTPEIKKVRTDSLYDVVEPIDYENFPTKFKRNEHYENPVTHDLITYELSPEQARNPIESILLNGKKIGEYVGGMLTELQTSPTGRYASFGNIWACGGYCTEYYIYVIDFKTGNFWSISPPISRESHESNLYIESHLWLTGTDVIELTAFMTDMVSGERMRVSHKQVWRYDLDTRSFTFERELPESVH